MKLRPSGAPIWGNCSGAAQVLDEALDIVHPRTLEGTAAHWLAAEGLRCYMWFGSVPPLTSFKGRTCTESGLVIDDEMIEGADLYVRDVLETLCNVGGDLLIEHPIECPQIDPENAGTLDAALVNFQQGVIILWDYKHGHGEVSPRSLQLVNYAAGLINKYQINGVADQRIRVELRIVQPFCYQNDGPVQIWRGYLSDLRGDINQLTASAAEARRNPTLRSGAHCYHCPALWRCPAARNHIYKTLDHCKNPPIMDDMPGDALAIERALVATAEKLAKARLSALEDLITERVKNGDASIPLSLESKPGRLKWTVDAEQVIGIGRMIGADFDKKEPITPTQAIDRFPEVEDVIKRHAVKSSALKLVSKSKSIGARAFGTTQK